MKRFAKAFLVLVTLIVIGYLGYKELKKTRSLLGKVHVGADSALKIGIHEIKETLVLDALASPGYYYEQAKFSESDDKDTPDKGVDLLPYNLVFFTLPDIKNTFFGTFKIKDSEEFEEYIAQEIEKRSATVEEVMNGDYRFAKIEKSKVALAWNGEQLVIAISPELKLEPCHAVFKDVLRDRKTISDNGHALIEALADHNDHIVFVDGKSSVTLNFEDGKALVTGNLLTKTPQKFQAEITTETIANASFQLYFDANFENSLNKGEIIDALASASFFQKNGLNAVEVADRSNGFFSLAIDGTTKQTDTIITYGYDANFEKVEKRSLQEKQVPKVHINLGAEDQSLKDYLTGQKAVDTKGIFKPFPLYSLYVKDGSMYTAFDTFEGDMVTQEQLSSSFFGCRIDFRKLKDDLDVPKLRTYFGNLEKMKLFAAQKEGNLVVVNGELTAANPNINILSQLTVKRQLDSVQ